MLAALTAAALLASAPTQDPLSFDQTVTCAAMFFVQSQMLTEAEEVEAFQMGMVEMITRAEGMGSGMDSEAIIQSASDQADMMMAGIDAATDADAKDEVLWTWGPGMVACIDAVLA